MYIHKEEREREREERKKERKKESHSGLIPGLTSPEMAEMADIGCEWKVEGAMKEPIYNIMRI